MSNGAFTDFDAAALPKPLVNLHRFWKSKRPDARLPSRADLNPVEMKAFLPHAFLIDVIHTPHDSPRFRIRLAGALIAEALGGGLSGKYLDEFEFDRGEAGFNAACANSAKTMETIYCTGKIASLASRHMLSFKSLWAPFSSDGVNVDMIMAGVLVSRPLLQQ